MKIEKNVEHLNLGIPVPARSTLASTSKYNQFTSAQLDFRYITILFLTPA